MNRLAKTAWHRKASKPVTVWMAALMLISLVHWALPNYRWVLIHMFTLGIVTNSIMLWSQHFTEKFLHRQLPEETRPWQLRRFAILNVGILLIITGQLTKNMFAQHWHVTAVGATVVGGSLAFHAGYLGRQYLQAKRGQRYAPSVIAYICSACCLPLGALAGAALAAGFPNPWQERLLLTHLILNILGFVGFAAIGSLMLLFPAIWRTQAHYERAPLTFALMSIGLTTAAGGALFGQGLIVAGGLVAYLIGIIIPIMSWGACVVTVLRDPRDRVTFAAVSVAAAPLWLCGTLIVLAYRAAIDLGTTAVSRPTPHRGDEQYPAQQYWWWPQSHPHRHACLRSGWFVPGYLGECGPSLLVIHRKFVAAGGVVHPGHGVAGGVLGAHPVCGTCPIGGYP